MATNEMQKSSSDKEPKTLPPPPPSSQEPSSAAYSSMPPHGFVASSPQPHPYMCGGSGKLSHMMPPYGTRTLQCIPRVACTAILQFLRGIRVRVMLLNNLK
ncbi:unnamed protein product [Brassica oleracea var. botrytis]